MDRPNKSTKVEPAKAKASKQSRLMQIIVGTIVIALVFIGLYQVTNRSPKKNQLTEKIRYTKMIKDSNQAGALNDIYKEKNILDNYLKDQPDNQSYLYEAEVRLTATCLALKNYSCANDAGKRAINVKVQNKYYSIYELLGDVNVKLKKYDDAVSFYNQGIEILKASKDPTAGGPRGRLESKVNYVNNVLKKQ